MNKAIAIEGLKPVGAYSAVVQSGNFYFVSGIIGINYETGVLEAKTFEEEVRTIMQHIDKVLKTLNLSWEAIVKATVYLTNMDNFGKFNEIYGSYFPVGYFPAREVVEVRRLPKDVNCEVSLILSAGD